MDYCNLRGFSTYSLFKSIIKIPELLDYCVNHNIPAVSLCEEMNMFGFVEFTKQAIEKKIKPIFGCILKIHNYGNLPFFIKNQSGYEFLSYVLSQYYIKNSEFITLEELQEHTGIICLTGCENSIFYDFQDQNLISESLKKLKNIFKNDLFIEIQPQKGKNLLLEQAIKHDIPIVCTNPVRFLVPEDRETFYVLQCLGGNKKYNKEELDDLLEKNDYMHTKASLQSLFDFDLTEGIENSVQIAKMCNFIIQESPAVIPKFTENGETDEAKILEKHAKLGLKERLKTIDGTQHYIYYERLEKELEVLKIKNFSGYFLVTADFVKKAKELDVPVGPARGSGAGSLVAYSLTITDIDPIKFDLIFERFLNPERNSMPDFDIDFCPEKRELVVEYLRQKYGYYNILQIVTFGTMQAKGVIRDVFRVFNLSFRESDAITRLIPHDQIHSVKLIDAIKLIPELKKSADSVKYKKLFNIALKLEGLIRNTSKHAAGLIISDKPVWKMCPLYRDEKGDLTVQFDFQDIEYVGGIKFDFLGLRTLTVIDDTLKLIKTRYNKHLTFNNIPIDDHKTFQLIKTGNLDGIFQFDGAGIRDTVIQLKPDTLEDLIVLNALYRPGPIKSIPDYIKRKHKQAKIIYLHPLTESVLEKTYGIMVYQEQVMAIAQVCAGYSFGEADSLRRAMGKKKIEEMKKNQEKFLAGAKLKGIPEDIANQLFDQMSEFSGYGFNKSHSAPYALIAYVCAYLKAHYPAEFLSCFLSEEMSNTEKIIRFVQNVKQMQIKISLPCINKSFNKFTIEDTQNSSSIRYGLGALKNLGENTIAEIVKNRGNSEYLDIYDFVNKNILVLNKKSWEALVYSGALDTFNIPREYLLDSLQDIKTGKLIIQNGEKVDYFTRMEREKDIFGFFINNYIQTIDNTLKNLGCKTFREIDNHSIKSCYYAAEISMMRRRRVKDQTFYAFVEAIDQTGILYITVFSNILEKYSNKLIEGNFLIFKIGIEKAGGRMRATAKEILTIDEFLQLIHTINIKLDSKHDIQEVFKILKDAEIGLTKVMIYAENESFLLDKTIIDSIELRKRLDILNITVE